MQIIPLSEGSFTVDKTKAFVPFDQQSDDLQARAKGSLLVEVQPFALVSAEDIILLDTGLGFLVDGFMQIHQNLHAAGIDPANVTKVLLSHLHKDHAGGISLLNDSSLQGQPAFPNATYFVQRQELEYAKQKGSPSYDPQEIAALEGFGKLRLLEGDGVIDGYIRHELTGAHCPFHQVFWIVDGGETVFFGADVAPQYQQMKNRFVAKYDFDGRRCMELRQQWWQQGEREHWTFLFYHDIATAVWRF